MKRFVVLFIALITLVVTGCSEKFKIAAPYKNITVVYGFLDKADTAHYVRIQKGFLDENKSSLAMAQEPDSNYYASLNVRIERINFSNLTIHDTIHLDRVDLTAEGYPKQPGQFFTAPNYAYKFKGTLDPAYIYRLKIINTVTGNVDSAETAIIEDTDPSKFDIDALDSSLHPMLDFSNTSATKYYEVNGQLTPPPGFTYQGSSYPAVIANMFIRFNWDDSDIITHEHTHHYYDYNAGYKSMINGSFVFRAYNNSLFTSLASSSAMGIAPQNQIRLMDRADIIVYVSTPDFAAYQQATLTQGTGLTGTEIEPIYTNIKGKDVVGLFTARGMRGGKITLTQPTLDSLMHSSTYAQAVIRGTVYH